MGSYILKDGHLKANNTKYYRSNGIELGDVGSKRTSVLSVNRVDSHSNIPAPKMKVQHGETISMDSTFASSIASFFSYGGLSAAGLKKELTRGKLKVARYFMEERHMINGIEKSPKLIDTIRHIGRDARVVSEVWIVASADIVEESSSRGLLGFTGSGGLASGVSMSKGNASISISPGAVLAYMLHKIDWKEKQKKNWSHIDLLIPDPKGL
ncbi:MAG: hypothetical protein AB8B63_16630 [Granulosicoccus sp.]